MTTQTGIAWENSSDHRPLTKSDILQIVHQVVALLSVPGGSAVNTPYLPVSQDSDTSHPRSTEQPTNGNDTLAAGSICDESIETQGARGNASGSSSEATCTINLCK